jgi:hypothetical protein
MSIYSLVALGGSGLGPLAAGWVEMNPHLQWRWIQWIHAMSVFQSILFGWPPAHFISPVLQESFYSWWLPS